MKDEYYSLLGLALGFVIASIFVHEIKRACKPKPPNEPIIRNRETKLPPAEEQTFLPSSRRPMYQVNNILLAMEMGIEDRHNRRFKL